MSQPVPGVTRARRRTNVPGACDLRSARTVPLLVLVALCVVLMPPWGQSAESESAEPEPAASAPAEVAEAAEAAVPTLKDARELFTTGQYADCASLAGAALEELSDTESWYVLKLRSELAVGDHQSALATLEDALIDHRYSIRLRWYGLPVSFFNGDPESARELTAEIESLVKRMSWRYSDPEDRIVLGRFLLRRGVDPREVLEKVYDRLKKEEPEFAGSYVASGDLALDKDDYAVAADEFRQGLKLVPDDPEVLFGLARALAPSDPAGAEVHLRAALESNPNHVDCLLFLIDSAVDREAYDEARVIIQRVLAIDKSRPAAHAYRAVLAHVEGDYIGETAARTEAFGKWKTNPEVDWLIGRKLSQKYRFAEGAAYQRRALAFDKTYLPALMQLSQDLLRLGQEDDGWRLVKEVYLRDGYNVVAHNLDTLHDHIEKFHTLEAKGLIVRMEAREAAIYGERVLDLLKAARDTLCAKYDIRLRQPVLIEVFPERQDFAIRTFGLPGGEGFLGVCFGNVITANSPAALVQSPTSWEAVLWHEFCHVVTLHKTRNRMPRWLSEGISVYEEKQKDPSWGQTMIPAYLEIIRDGGVLPVSRLSGAFLRPPTPLHLQFAYYQSSLVVEYLIEKHGMGTLKEILSDLTKGQPINDVLERRTGSLEKLDKGVDAFVLERAGELESKADWSAPDLPDDADADALAAWVRVHPDSFRGLQRQAISFLSEERWNEARKPLERLIELCPEYTQPGNAYDLLARVYRELSEPDAEREILGKLSALDADLVSARLRLLDLCTEAEDWIGLATTAERLLAVNPLLEAPHRGLVRAAEELGTPERAIPSYRVLLLLDPIDPAELHFRLGRVLRSEGDLDAARRQLLQSLEEAPRFRAAHRELLALVQQIEQEQEQEQEQEKDVEGESE